MIEPPELNILSNQGQLFNPDHLNEADTLAEEAAEVRQPPLSKAAVSGEFFIHPEVAHRFNCYAAAAYPMEIGGLVRVVEVNGRFEAVDLKVFEQEVSSAYFELDGEAVALFNMELVKSGRADEISQWCSLIHSHPSMTPFMSGTDKANVRLLAGDSFAFSIICSAEADPEENYYAVHYAQREPLDMIVSNIAFDQEGLAGCGLVGPNERQEIEREVEELCSPLASSVRSGSFMPSYRYPPSSFIADGDMSLCYEALSLCDKFDLIDGESIWDAQRGLDDDSLNESTRATILEALEWMESFDLLDSAVAAYEDIFTEES